MRIAIDISPLSTGHSIRGVGFYLSGLMRALPVSFPNDEFVFYHHLSELKERPDIIHVPYFDPFAKSIPIIEKNTSKLVVTVHDLTPLVLSSDFPVGIKGKLRWELQKRALRQVDSVITDSLSSQKDIAELTNIQKSNITVVPLAADSAYTKIASEKVTPVLRKYHLSSRYLLYVGDVTANKNLPRLIEAVRKIDLPLVLVGKAITAEGVDLTHPWNKDLAFVRQALTKQTNILALGFLPTEDVVALYNGATAFIMPSLYEGFGLPVLEAMQCGCPVVTSRHGSLPEVAGESAVYVDPYDVQDITNGIQKLTGDESLRKSLITNGQKQAAEFTWEKTARETFSVYEKIH